MSSVGDKFYKVYAQSYSVIIDAEREEYGSSPLYLKEAVYKVVKVTPKGVWIDYQCDIARGRPHFVRLDSRKKFAYPTREQALDGFIAKKRRHVSILSAQHDDALQALNMALRVKAGEHVWHSEVKVDAKCATV